ALAPAINQMGGREAAGSAPCFWGEKRGAVPETVPPTERTRVVRESHRGAYDRESIYKILDEGYVCHVGFAVDVQPYVIPTLFARIGDTIYFHGSAASRMPRQPSEKELKATSILCLPLTEVSAKIRVGPPEDDAPDYALPVWAGVIPLPLTPGTPIRDEKCDPSIPTPDYAAHYRR